MNNTQNNTSQLENNIIIVIKRQKKITRNIIHQAKRHKNKKMPHYTVVLLALQLGNQGPQ